jgi:hypothetical protein
MYKSIYCNPSTILEFWWEFDLNVQRLRPVTLLIIGMLKKQNNSLNNWVMHPVARVSIKYWKTSVRNTAVTSTFRKVIHLIRIQELLWKNRYNTHSRIHGQMKCSCHYNSATSRALLQSIWNRAIRSNNFGRDAEFDSDSCSVARCKLTKKLEVMWNSKWSSHVKKKTPWSESASELYRPSDRRFSAKWLPTFANRGCHVVSVMDPYGRILGF